MTDSKKLAEELREAAKRADYFQTGEQGLLNRAAEVIGALSAHTPTDDEREAHSHEGEARVWCETHQHEHIASMPRFTYLCKDCGWGQWYGDQAREHEFWTQENLREAHVTYEVEHVTRPIAWEPHGEPSGAPTVRLMAQKGGKRQALIEQMLAQANERGVRVEVVDQVIPRYAMLDVWMALYGHETSQAFDAFYKGAEYSEAWSTLLAAIRTRAGEPQGEPSDPQVLNRVEQFAQSEGVMFAGGPRGAWLPVDALLDILGERTR